jgi:hypothetical protein
MHTKTKANEYVIHAFSVRTELMVRVRIRLGVAVCAIHAFSVRMQFTAPRLERPVFIQRGGDRVHG